MLFEQKNSAPDRGKNNFKQFMIDDAGEKPQLISPRGKNWPEIKLPSLNYEQTNRRFKEMISTTKSGNTWDVRHLDKFLRNSKFARSIDTRSLSTNFLPQEEESVVKTTNIERSFRNTDLSNEKAGGKNKILFSNISKTPHNQSNSASKESFYFRSQPRFEDDKIYKVYDFYPATYSEENPLVLNINDKRKLLADEFFKLNLSSPVKEFTPNKLDISAVDSGLRSSKEYRSETLDLKRNLENYQVWKDETRLKNKKISICKNSYKSGIISVDSPCDENTKIYQEEYNRKLEQQRRKEYLRAKHMENVLKIQGTNQNIGFSNPQSFQAKSAQKSSEPLKEEGGPAYSEKIWHNWQSKRHRFSEEKSFHRVFGGVTDKPASKFRVTNILFNENRGKEYDIVNNTVLKTQV